MQKDSVNYAAFIEAVDPEFRSAICDTCEKSAGSSSATGARSTGGGANAKGVKSAAGGELVAPADGASDAAALDDLLARIRHIVITKRLRVRGIRVERCCSVQQFSWIRLDSERVRRAQVRAQMPLGCSAVLCRVVSCREVSGLGPARARAPGVSDTPSVMSARPTGCCNTTQTDPFQSDPIRPPRRDESSVLHRRDELAIESRVEYSQLLCSIAGIDSTSTSSGCARHASDLPPPPPLLLRPFRDVRCDPKSSRVYG